MTCPMCDGSEITATFHSGSTYWGDLHSCGYGAHSYWVNVRRDEHLHYRCETCRYDWTADTAGAAVSHE